MKKLAFIVLAVLMLSLTACSPLEQPADVENSVQSENDVMLDKGMWPVNEYTDGLSVPPGTVSWVQVDEKQHCSIQLTEISEEEWRSYLARLQQEGFSVVQEVAEEIKGQDAISMGVLLSNGEKGVSMSYTSSQCVIFISLMQ